MEDDAWVHVTPVAQQGRPDKKVYTLNLKEWRAEWGALDSHEAPQARGALAAPIPVPAAREVYLLQRSKGAQGGGLGKPRGGCIARR